MSKYIYRVIPAPTRGVKAKGVRSAEDRFSNALEQKMNSLASEGWEYQRAETLPSVERSGLTSTTTNWRNVLVFRKLKETPAKRVEVAEPVVTLAPPAPELVATRGPKVTTPVTPEDDASSSQGASRMLHDNGVEGLSDVSGMTDSLKQLAKTRNSDKSDD